MAIKATRRFWLIICQIHKVVVDEHDHDGQEHRRESRHPKQRTLAHYLALLEAEHVAFVDVVGDVASHVGLVHEQRRRLQRLQLVPDQDLVVEQVRADEADQEQDERG